MKVRRLKCGVGINLLERPTKDANGFITKEYAAWAGMIQRCYDVNVQRRHPTYVGCKVSTNFKSYTFFYDWCQLQKNFGKTGFELDKDILGCGKLYSEDVCAFIPTHINKLLVLRGNARGSLPLGVTKVQKEGTNAGYIARLSMGNTRKYLGYFEAPEDAHACYIKAKHIYIEQLANDFKDVLDERVYEKLLQINLERI